MKKINFKACLTFVSAALICLVALKGMSWAEYLDSCAGNKTQNCCTSYAFLPQQLDQLQQQCKTDAIKTCAWDATASLCTSVCTTDPSDDCNKATTQAACKKHNPGKSAQALCGGKTHTGRCHWLITKDKPNGYCSVDCK